MIQEQSNFTIITDDSMPSCKFNLKEENLAHVFNILRSNLYSDKVLAVIREYSCNAYDANVENNKPDTPIIVTLPNIYDPVFKVRDNGLGLSEEDVFNVFSSYGASTKRNTNKLIGTLGMGSKSGFGYGDSFTVTSWNGGFKKIYEAYIDETQIGTIAKIHEEASDEPTGLEITIAVRKDDINDFINKARVFYTWFNPMPTFFGYSLKESIKKDLDSFTTVFKSSTFHIFTRTYQYNKSVSVRMGNIVYPVTDLSCADFEWLRNANIILDVEMGSVTFTTSRESLEMTPKTVNTLKRRIAEIIEEIKKKFQFELDKCETPWEALQYNYNLPQLVQNISSQGFTWRGQNLNPQFHNAMCFASYQSYKKQWNRSTYNIYRKDNKLGIIVNDGGYPTSQTRGRLEIAKSKLESTCDVVLYARGTVADSKAFLEANELVGATVVKLSDVASNDKNQRLKVVNKNKFDIFTWNGETGYPYSRSWDVVESVPSDEKVYVHIESYLPQRVGFSTLHNFLANMKFIGRDIVLYGVREGYQLDNTWIEWSQYLEKVALDILNDTKYQQDYMADALKNNRQHISVLREKHADLVSCDMVKKYLKFDNKETEGQFATKTKIVSIAGCYSQAVSSMVTALAIDAKNKVEESRSAYNSIVDKYPLLSRSYSSDAQDYINYINAMKKCFA